MYDLMLQGGLFLWIIMGSGLLAFGVFLERAWHLHRARIKSEDFLRGITNILKRKNFPEAMAICDETPGPVAYIVKTAILYRRDRREAVATAVENASMAEVSRMERRLVIIATVAQIAPLLGLLGTVQGMVEALLSMQAAAPLIQVADITGGFLRALITTAGGLMTAIPCYVAFNLLVVKIDRLVLDMEKAATEFIPFITGLDEPAEDGVNGMEKQV